MIVMSLSIANSVRRDLYFVSRDRKCIVVVGKIEFIVVLRVSKVIASLRCMRAHW